ncbi:MAG: L-threonylcarbamoyladenylate synthase [Spirochaetes bacterium]|nr:L-threonylcarbamoyladenylate synthase [Spirochaetota bacterium]
MNSNFIKIENLEKFTEKDLENIKKASQVIKNGGIVAFPTETVYGLGASIYIEEAINKIYEVKKRPKDNPLIAHVSSLDMALQLVFFDNDFQRRLFEYLSSRFWPGPISFILKKSDKIKDFATCGLETISIRMPDNKIALSLIEYSGCPIVAPSANLSGKPSCTKADDVLIDFGNNIDLIIDGGIAPIGIESTVLDLHLLKNDNKIFVLRPGYITLEDIKKEIRNFIKKEKKLGNIISIEVLYSNSILNLNYKSKSETKVLSPGVKYKHYKPDSLVILVKKRKIFNYIQIKNKITKIIENFKGKKETSNNKNGIRIIKIWILFINRTFKESIFKIVEDINFRNEKKFLLKYEFIHFNNEYELAKDYYSLAREGDKNNIDILIVEGLDKNGFKFSLMNRLSKSSDIMI